MEFSFNFIFISWQCKTWGKKSTSLMSEWLSKSWLNKIKRSMLLLYTGNFSLCLLEVLKYIHYLSFHIAWIKSANSAMYSVVHKLCYCFGLSNNNYTFKFLMFLNNWIDSGAQLHARNNKHQSRVEILTCDYVHFIIALLKNHYGLTKLSL